jgi:hypothetical protein
MARTIVYIDGFNLYYRALKGTSHKWLDLEALSRASLPANVTIVGINYYTARVSGRVDPDAPKSQHAYLRAISTKPLVKVHYGRFLTNQKWAGLAPPVPSFKPDPTTLTIAPDPIVAKVWKTEEKGSDVNLAAHLVRDAFLKAFDEAAILTNDTDLCEPMRIVRACNASDSRQYAAQEPVRCRHACSPHRAVYRSLPVCADPDGHQRQANCEAG